MNTLEKFQPFRLDNQTQLMIKGGDICTDCLRSAIIACKASCGDNSNCVAECNQNQMNQCWNMYCL